MSLIGVSVYSLSLENSENGENLFLNNLYEGDFMDLFIDFLRQNFDSCLNNELMEKVLKIQRNYNDDSYVDTDGTVLFRHIIGNVKTGGYGYSSEIIHTETGEVAYTRGVGDAELMPFYFSLSMPKLNTGVNRCLLLLQNHGIFGMKSIFVSELNSYIKSINSKYRIIIRNVAPTEYIENYLNMGILQKVRFIRYNIPTDRANRLGINHGIEQCYDEYVINKPLGFIEKNKNAINKFIRGQANINNIVEIDGFDYNNVKLEIKKGKRIRTINLNNFDKLVINEDITEDVQLVDGHPTEESITPILVDLSKNYLKEMGLI